MAIYENKFEIGDKVVVTNKMLCFDLWLDMASVMEVNDFSSDWPNEREVHKVISYTLHPDTHHFVYHVKNCITEKGYLMLEEGLELYNGQDKEKVEQSPKQQYKQRAKWVMNIGSKPDLPDGTLVKAVFDEGGVIADVDKLRWSIADHIGQTNIVKWKLADDWNKVVNGQAPDIDGDTLVEVVCKDEHGRFTTTATKDDLFWGRVKKWRYAKEKKAK